MAFKTPFFAQGVKYESPKSEADLVNMPRLSQFITEIQKLKQLFTVITGKEISEISMFFAEYKWTDHLLTHEDDLQNRVIAFVYYLNRNPFKILRVVPVSPSVDKF